MSVLRREFPFPPRLPLAVFPKEKKGHTPAAVGEKCVYLVYKL